MKCPNFSTHHHLFACKDYLEVFLPGHDNSMLLQCVTRPAELQQVLQGAGRVQSVQQILLELNLIHDISK